MDAKFKRCLWQDAISKAPRNTMSVPWLKQGLGQEFMHRLNMEIHLIYFNLCLHLLVRCSARSWYQLTISTLNSTLRH